MSKAVTGLNNSAGRSWLGTQGKAVLILALLGLTACNASEPVNDFVAGVLPKCDNNYVQWMIKNTLTQRAKLSGRSDLSFMDAKISDIGIYPNPNANDRWRDCQAKLNFNGLTKQFTYSIYFPGPDVIDKFQLDVYIH